MARHHYDESYREEIELSDGTPVVLRLVRPSDKELLSDGLACMSMESRYRRFFSVRKSLGPKELKYLTEFDGENHLAIGAVREHDDGTEEGVGVARFARLDDRAQAEPAVAVVDDYHRKGLGTQLLQRLAAAAWERNVRWFRFEFLEENEPVHHLVDSMPGAPVRLYHIGHGVVAAEVPVPEIRPGDRTEDVMHGTSTHALLSHAASGRLSARMRLGRLVLKHLGDPEESGEPENTEEPA